MSFKVLAAVFLGISAAACGGSSDTEGTVVDTEAVKSTPVVEPKTVDCEPLDCRPAPGGAFFCVGGHWVRSPGAECQ